MATDEDFWGSGTATETWQALDYFTDRHAAIRRFTAHLNDAAAPPTANFFHGAGGNGKTLLLRFLQERCCKCFDPDNWDYLQILDDAAFVENVVAAADAAEVPRGRLDFAQ